MRNDRFGSMLKICAYEAITERLVEAGQITTAEAIRIGERISMMKQALVVATPTTKHHLDEKAA